MSNNNALNSGHYQGGDDEDRQNVVSSAMSTDGVRNALMAVQNTPGQTIHGTANDDTLTGTSGDDTIYGYAGVDTINGGDGDDTVYTGTGGGFTNGGDGNDTIYTEGSVNASPLSYVYGNEGNDTIYGGSGYAHIDGGEGADTITGGSGNEGISGGDDDDILNGGDGDDGLYAGAGNDTLIGGAGNDTLQGGGSNNPGIDTADYSSATSRIVVNLSMEHHEDATNAPRIIEQQAFDGLGGVDTIRDIDVVIASDYDDFLYGSQFNHTTFHAGAGDDYIENVSYPTASSLFPITNMTAYAGDGNDTIVGSFGNDVMHGEDGNDMLYTGRAGDNTLKGGAGNDWFQIRSAGNNSIDGGAGIDEVDYSWSGLGVNANLDQNSDLIINNGSTAVAAGTAVKSGGGVDQITSIEKFMATYGDDYVRANAGTDTTLNGLDGDDFLYGQDGNDIINGGEGDDNLFGGEGDDVINGGEGSDRAIFSGSIDDFAFSNFQTHPASGSASSYQSFTMTDTVGNSGTDTISSIESFQFTDVLMTMDQLKAYGTGAAMIITKDNVVIPNSTLTHSYTGGDLVINNPVFLGDVGSDYVVTLTDVQNSVSIGWINNMVGSPASPPSFDLTINSGSADDNFNITYGYATINAGGGDDTVNGSVEHTTVAGQLGDDTITNAYTAVYRLEIWDYYIHRSGSSIIIQDSHYFDGTDTLTNVESLDFGGTGNLTNLQVGTSGDDVLDENDALTSGSSSRFSNILAFGGDGNDRLNGSDGDDHFYGESGDDILFGGLGDDVLYGGVGLDTAVYSSGSYTDFTFSHNRGGLVLLKDNNALDFDEGIDYLIGIERIQIGAGPARDILLGTKNDDNLSGTAGDELIFGNVGDDILNASSGYDILDGGLGNDTADYSAINEWLLIDLSANIGEWNDLHGIYTDTLVSIENVIGTDFADTILGDAADNILNGGAGDDTFGNSDIISGGAGNDTILGGSGDDFLAGGAGNDTIDGGADGNLTGDTLTYYSLALGQQTTSGVVVNLLNGIATDDGQGGVDTITGIENVNGTQFDDHITGDNNDNIIFTYGGNNTLYGKGGDDNLNGADGTDVLYGEDGNDHFDGGAGNDTAHGGDGDDTFYNEAGDDIFYGGDGIDTVDYSRASTGVVVSMLNVAWTYDGTNSVDRYTALDGFGGTDTIRFIETVIGSGHDDYIRGTNQYSMTLNAGAGNDTILGQAMNDVINAGTGNDYISASGGNDEIYGDAGRDNIFGGNGDDEIHAGDDDDWVNGGNGNDTLYGDGGVDIMTGGAGDDTMYGGDGNDIINANDGADTVYGGDGDDTIRGYTGNDEIHGGEGNDKIFGGRSINDTFDSDDVLYGDAGNDILYGLGGDDELYGGEGNDNLYGYSGADILRGGEGIDTLRGGSGNDTLYSEGDRDKLFGEGGADTFAFEGASAFDNLTFIQDFDAAEDDVIDISNVLTGFTQGSSDINDFIIFSESAGHTYVWADSNGAAAGGDKGFVARLTGTTGLDLDALLGDGNIVV